MESCTGLGLRRWSFVLGRWPNTNDMGCDIPLDHKGQRPTTKDPRREIIVSPDQASDPDKSREHGQEV